MRWLLAVEPARIARHPGVLPALDPLIGEDDWKAFRGRNGFDLRETEDALIAGFDFGTLFLLATSDRDAAIERRFRQRLLRGHTSARPHPDVIRVQGVVGETPQTLVRARGHLIALAEGDPSLARIVEGYLLQRFRKTPTALAGAALRDHADFAAGFPLRLWVPGPQQSAGEMPPPFDQLAEALPGVTAFLAGADFFEERPCACRPEAPAGPALRLRIAAAGPWDPEGVSPEPLGVLWDSLAASPSGRLLHLDTPLRPPRPMVAPRTEGARLEITVDLALGPLLRGLYELLAGELEQIFSPPPGDSSTHPEGLPLSRGGSGP